MSKITLYHGDCLEIMKDLEDGSVDAVVTDPPYFLPIQTYVGTREDGWKRRTLGDMSVVQTYFDTVFEKLIPKIRQTGSVYVFCDGQSYPILYRSMFPYFKYVRPVIWNKKISYNGYTWRHQHELIAWGEGFEAERIPTGDGDVLSYRGVLQKNRLHPAEKPVDLQMKLMEKCGDIIFDPYMGSASSGEACVRNGKEFIGIEIDKQYYDIAEKRIAEAQLQMRMPI